MSVSSPSAGWWLHAARPSLRASGTVKHRFPFPLPPSERGAPIGQAPLVSLSSAGCDNLAHGDRFLRRHLPATAWTRGHRACDAYPRIVGPTGRGLTADIADLQPPRRPGRALASSRAGERRREPAKSDGTRECPPASSPAFLLDSPGEYEVHHVLITGVATFRDDDQGAERGTQHHASSTSSTACTSSTWATSAIC